MFSFNFIQHICEYDEVLNPSFLSFFIFQFFFSILSFFFYTTFFSAKLLFYLHHGANGKGNCLFSILCLFLFETQSQIQMYSSFVLLQICITILLIYLFTLRNIYAPIHLNLKLLTINQAISPREGVQGRLEPREMRPPEPPDTQNAHKAPQNPVF